MSTGKLIFTITNGIIEFERDMIVKRTQAGEAIAKLKDWFTEERPPKIDRICVLFHQRRNG